MRSVYRVQDREGRGPFKPGMTRRWADAEGFSFMPPFHDEFGIGIIKELQTMIGEVGGACGCAVATMDMIDKWFTPTERARLAALGYFVVLLSVDAILRESPNQIVFWRRLPLRKSALVMPWRSTASPQPHPPEPQR